MKTGKSKINVNDEESKQKLSNQMKLINPKYSLREWHLVWAYKEAQKGNYEPVNELQEIMTKPYEEQTKEIEEKYDTKKPSDFFGIAGISHVSCSVVKMNFTHNADHIRITFIVLISSKTS